VTGVAGEFVLVSSGLLCPRP